MITSNVRILRLNTIVIKTGIARSTIYDWLNPKSPRYDSSFPKPRKLGKQSVGWLESEIDGWINEIAKTSKEA
ncbi:AlpA family phage regulatory protein [Arsenophonus endosymbiont of Aphis craccivora]|nr:AlpA family phage regulatory protein [Arsenophonus endosymbiont of Aphis craccivora]